MDWAKTVLVLIDIQNDYLPGGKFELLESEKASLQAKEVLEAYRRRKLPIIHVKHESAGPNAAFFLPGTPGADIHPNVEPDPGEPVILKHKPSSFIDTNFSNSRDRLSNQKLPNAFGTCYNIHGVPPNPFVFCLCQQKIGFLRPPL